MGAAVLEPEDPVVPRVARDHQHHHRMVSSKSVALTRSARRAVVPCPPMRVVTQAMDQIRALLLHYFEGAPPELLAVYLFGSVARRTAGTASDVDLGLLYASRPPSTLDGLPLGTEADLERLVGRPVQAVVLNNAPPDLIHRVLRDGELLLDRDRPQRIRFEVDARNRYFDSLPLLRRYRRPA